MTRIKQMITNRRCGSSNKEIDELRACRKLFIEFNNQDSLNRGNCHVVLSFAKKHFALNINYWNRHSDEWSRFVVRGGRITAKDSSDIDLRETKNSREARGQRHNSPQRELRGQFPSSHFLDPVCRASSAAQPSASCSVLGCLPELYIRRARCRSTVRFSDAARLISSRSRRGVFKLDIVLRVLPKHQDHRRFAANMVRLGLCTARIGFQCWLGSFCGVWDARETSLVLIFARELNIFDQISNWLWIGNHAPEWNYEKHSEQEAVLFFFFKVGLSVLKTINRRIRAVLLYLVGKTVTFKERGDKCGKCAQLRDSRSSREIEFIYDIREHRLGPSIFSLSFFHQHKRTADWF